jgi:hypothetical protein
MCRATKTKRKESIKVCKTCMGRKALHVCTGVPMSAERRPGFRISDNQLRTHVRAECTAAAANIRDRMVESDDVDETMTAVRGRPVSVDCNVQGTQVQRPASEIQWERRMSARGDLGRTVGGSK